MTSKEFVVWMQGFVEACNEYSPTPKQWDTLKDKLGEVKDDTTSSPFPFGVPNTAPIVTLPYITPGPSTDPYNPYKITCERGGTLPISGSISIAGPNVLSFTTGSAVAYGISTPPNYNPSTTTFGYPSGSSWHYTNTLVHGTLHATDESKEYFAKQKDKDEKSNQLELDFEPK
jgi:hypothetical protein